MKVKFKVIGELKRRIGQAAGTVDIKGEPSVEQLLQSLNIEDQELIVMLNGIKAAQDKRLSEGDEVVLIPVAIGG
ncbi:MAG: MoaD/ThiS family protein [Candidatus Saccharibacteria bacterium]